MQSTVDRFWENVIPEPMSGCHLWLGQCTVNNRGQFRADGKTVYAYRFSWELQRGPIPFGMKVCHKCDNPNCVNPDHLFLGTQADNLLDMRRKGRAGGNTKHKGEINNMARLNSEIVRAIRASKLGSRPLGRLYGVDKATIQRVRRGQTWRHVV